MIQTFYMIIATLALVFSSTQLCYSHPDYLSQDNEIILKDGPFCAYHSIWYACRHHGLKKSMKDISEILGPPLNNDSGIDIASVVTCLHTYGFNTKLSELKNREELWEIKKPFILVFNDSLNGNHVQYIGPSESKKQWVFDGQRKPTSYSVDTLPTGTWPESVRVHAIYIEKSGPTLITNLTIFTLAVLVSLFLWWTQK